jgi:hypothetical protein
MPERRIDTGRILHKVFIENIPKFRVADEECCSRSYVTKVCNKHADNQREGQRMERLAALLPGKSVKVLKWAAGRTYGGLSGTNAVLEAFDATSRKSAKEINRRLEADPDNKKAIETILFEEGCGRRYRVQKLKKVIDSKDLGLSIRGLDTSFKLCGDFQAEKLDVLISYDAGAMDARYQELKGMLAEVMAMPDDAVIDLGDVEPKMIEGGK